MGFHNAIMYFTGLGGIMAEIWNSNVNDEVKAMHQSKYKQKV